MVNDFLVLLEDETELFIIHVFVKLYQQLPHLYANESNWNIPVRTIKV